MPVNKRGREGFTLVELIVVLAILAILTTMAMTIAALSVLRSIPARKLRGALPHPLQNLAAHDVISSLHLPFLASRLF